MVIDLALKSDDLCFSSTPCSTWLRPADDYCQTDHFQQPLHSRQDIETAFAAVRGLTLLTLDGALGTARMAASLFIEQDTLHPELGPSRTKRGGIYRPMSNRGTYAGQASQPVRLAGVYPGPLKLEDFLALAPDLDTHAINLTPDVVDVRHGQPFRYRKTACEQKGH